MGLSPYGKARDFRVVQRQPFNGGPILERLAATAKTSVDQFFVRSHGAIPRVDVARWRLQVGGLVEEPLSLSLKELKRRFSRCRVEATLQCAGNRRVELLQVAPIRGELRWGPEAVSNAVWGGVRLRDVLADAGVRAGARHVHFVGADEARADSTTAPFGASISIRKALSTEVLLAFEMNGRSIARVHGFPLRVVVPGYIGARSVKWLRRVEVAARPSDNPFQARSYKRLAAGATALDVRRARALTDSVLNCVICAPVDGSRVKGRHCTVRGYAMGRGGLRLSRVEVSADQGRRWVRARLLGNSSPWAWRLWEARLRLAPGRTTLVARAVDSSGRLQPVSLAQAWNAKGYANNARHQINVEVHE